MRKRLIDEVRLDASIPEHNWLNVEDLAEVELTSEDALHPIESAFLDDGNLGWRAGVAGSQTIRLRFENPQRIRLIHLRFIESAVERTQEYVLRWSSDNGRSFQEIVRQQWNFNPSGTTEETEDHQVDLSNVTVLELIINPDIGNQNAIASLAKWRIA
jgi:hypothetical protein